jgi:energy-coupling factor transport system substrate-specific component
VRPSFVPNAGVARISIDGVEHTDFRERISIPRDASRLTAELSLLSFGLTDDSVLFYRLIGLNSEPEMLSRTYHGDISFTNLRGGYYTLRVWSQNAVGEIGNVVEIKMYKELGFFEHTSVWIILAFLFAVLIVSASMAIIRSRTRKLQLKQQEYRTIISQALTAIANTIDAKDSYTSGHSVRVAAYSVEIARKMGMDRDFYENLYYIALLHDVGKIGIPNEIINKPTSLSNDEYDAIKQHPEIGKNILSGITTIPHLTAGTAEHHERWDGKGYINELTGEEISLEARIIAIADTYDAMSHDRAYRKSLPREAILEEFKKVSGKQFDPAITAITIELIEQDYFNSIDINSIIGIN